MNKASEVNVNFTAVTLVLASGFLHASWNFLAKRSKDKLSFLWGAKALALLLLSPILAFYLRYFIGTTQLEQDFWFFIALGAASGLVHFGYNYFLSMAYRYGDISFTYPIARGLAPFLVALFSFLFIGEVPSVSGATGMLLIAGGMIFLVKSKTTKDESVDAEIPDYGPIAKEKAPLLFAVLTSIMIALYLFLDGRGSRAFTPFLFMYSYSLISTLLLAIPVYRRRKKFFREIKTNLKAICLTSIMMPLSYFLALSAMQLTQLGYVAYFRNISVVFASLFGLFLLKEDFTGFRLIGSMVIALGAIALSIG